MYYVYVMKSLKNGKRYTGLTAKNPLVRLQKHNQSGNKHWSGRNKPFELIYKESYSSEKEARRREKFFKTGNGRKFLDGKIVP